MTRKLVALLLSVGALGAIGFGLDRALRSPLYTLSAVEITTDPTWKEAPLAESEIRALAAIPEGETSLFSLDLEAVRERLLKEPWIEQVSLRKRFPQTLSVHVKFRRPVAVWVDGRGKARYLDSGGKVFGSLTFRAGVDLPVVHDVPEERIPGVLELLRGWSEAQLDRIASLSEIGWFGARGLRAMLVVTEGASRPSLELGQSFDADTEAKLGRLAQVLRYLVAKQEQVSGILVGDDKKVVVRTGHGS